MKTSAREWGTSGAGFLFVTKDKKVFLTLRTDGPEYCVNEPGEWGIPGGAVGRSERPLREAWCEPAEELTGGDVELLPRYETFGSVVYRDSDFEYTTFVLFVSREDADRWEWELNWENDDAGWFAISELPEPLHFGAEYVIDRLSEVVRNPLLKKRGKKKAVLGDVDVRESSNELFEDNVIGVGPFGIRGQLVLGLFSPDTLIIYFTIKPETTELIRERVLAGKSIPLFVMRRFIGAPGTIDQFWKHGLSRKLAGAIQFFPDEEHGEVVVTHMAVKPGWQRRGINSRMLNYLQSRYPNLKVVFHDPTEEGRAFMESWGGAEWGVEGPVENLPNRPRPNSAW